MKKVFSLSLSFIMIFTALLGFNFGVFAEGGADAVTSATTSYETTPSTATTKVNVIIPAGAGVYVVKSGDVMWRIAKAHNLTLDQLLKLNPWIKNANNIAVGQQILVKAGTETAVTAPVVAPVATTEQYLGLGMTTNFRARGTNYYFCITTASVLFDKSGKIVDAFVDVYEIGQSAITWPTEDATITVDAATAQVAGWLSKRDKGDTYGMAKSATTKNEWYVQMDNYQDFFKGKTVAELREWFNKSTGATGKPIVAATTTNEAELAKLALLTDAEKASLADVVSSATMSLSDSHSLIIEAVEEAYKNKVMVTK